jgi:hypothetical protein
VISQIGCRPKYVINLNTDVKSIAGFSAVPYLPEHDDLTRQDQDFDSHASPEHGF